MGGRRRAAAVGAAAACGAGAREAVAAPALDRREGGVAYGGGASGDSVRVGDGLAAQDEAIGAVRVLRLRLLHRDLKCL